MNKVNFS